MKYKLLLSFCLFLVIIFFITTIIFAINYFPQQAKILFGSPDPQLDFSQKLIYSVRLLASQNHLLGIANQAGKPVEISINSGETADQVSKKLSEEKIILNAKAFTLYLKYSGLDVRIRAGKYKIDPGKNSMQISQIICDLDPDSVKFIILPGMRVEEIAALLPTSGLNIDPEELIHLVKTPQPQLIREELSGVSSLEGFLFPDEYYFARKTTVNEFIQGLVNHFFEIVSPAIIERINTKGLSLYEGVVLASIIQREKIVQEDSPLIASVFHNRLSSGMMLNSDATVQYAVGDQKAGWWKNPLVTQDFQISSLYNTYLNYGLPPAAICNPDLDSLNAVAFPAKTGFYYFQAKCDQSRKHDFYTTYEEQKANLCN